MFKLSKENRNVCTMGLDEDIQKVEVEMDIDTNHYTIKVNNDIYEVDKKHNFKMLDAKARLFELTDDVNVHAAIIAVANGTMCNPDKTIDYKKYDKWLRKDFKNSLFGMVDKLTYIELKETKGKQYICATDMFNNKIYFKINERG